MLHYIIKKDDLTKKNAYIKLVLKECEYQESIMNKIFQRITHIRGLPQSQQGHSTPNGAKFLRLGYDLSQNLIKICQVF